MDNGSKTGREMMPQPHGGALQRGGPGRPKMADGIVEKIRAALVSDGSKDQLGIVDVLIARARKGERWAVEMCMHYGIGKPTEVIDLTLRLREMVATFAEEAGLDESQALAEVDAILAARRR